MFFININENLKKYYLNIPKSEYDIEVLNSIFVYLNYKKKNFNIKNFNLNEGVKKDSNVSQALVLLGKYHERENIKILYKSFYYIFDEMTKNIEKYNKKIDINKSLENKLSENFNQKEIKTIFIILNRLKIGFEKFNLTLEEYRRLHGIDFKQNYLETLTRLVNYLENKEYNHLIDGIFYLYKKIESVYYK